ncbi:MULTISPECIES: hypothetical protein [Clostridium]|uniref:Uncharacterized protein n=1 Tax=Clostridium cibarium TaxID=2762247 RepID=A0ABR8PUV4_9CLOT|nr:MULTISPECIES: hypothetical protein [Clostridium]MBD7911941.1 hypothetical protein [Clostridium cibarium]
MEYNNEDEKLGGGIITICVLHFIGLALTLLTLVGSFLMKDQLAQLGATTSTFVISAIISITLSVGCILILNKTKIGIILYYIAAIANLINTILYGFSITSIISVLFLPTLMGIFLNQKKELFGFKNK